MQHHPIRLDISLPGVCVVAKNRVTNIQAMYPDLVSPSRDWLDGKFRDWFAFIIPSSDDFYSRFCQLDKGNLFEFEPRYDTYVSTETYVNISRSRKQLTAYDLINPYQKIPRIHLTPHRFGAWVSISVSCPISNRRPHLLLLLLGGDSQLGLEANEERK